ncbi:oxidoreductase [Streptomyces sp. NPDC056144]|uniref:oxidoreductase n=1 Tax=unclassified Streptomyces TaxID=2593676 RepID=UPI0035DDBA75
MTIPPGPPPYGPGNGPGGYGYGYGYGPGYPPPPPKPGVIPLAPLGVGAILSGTFAAFGRHWKQLLGVTGAVYGAAIVVVLGAIGIAYASVADLLPAVFDLPTYQEPQWADVRPLLVAFGLVCLVATVAMAVAGAVLAAACPAVVQEAVLGRPLRFGELWRRAWSRTATVLGTTILTVLATMLPMLLAMAGFVGMFFAAFAASVDSDDPPVGDYIALPLIGVALALLLAPLSAWLWVKFSLAPSVAVMEGQGVTASMRRSSALIRDNWWRSFGVILLVGLIASAVAMVIQQILSMVAWIPLLGMHGGDSAGAAVVVVVVVLSFLILGQLVSQLAVSVFPAMATALLYVDLRIRKENLAPDLTRAAGL